MGPSPWRAWFSTVRSWEPTGGRPLEQAGPPIELNESESSDDDEDEDEETVHEGAK